MKAALVVLVSVLLVCFRIRAASQATPSQGGESCLLERPVCRVLADLTDQVAAEVERRTPHIGRLADLEERLAVHEKRHLTTTVPGEGGLNEAHQEIRHLKERLDSQEALYKDLLRAVEEIKKNEILPFVSNTEDNVLGNSNSDDGLSLLLTKVERVENITSEVQEELESEKRVRRYLEEDLNATRHDVRMLNDKFEMVAMVNRTLFEDRNETRIYFHRKSDEDKNRSLHFEEELEYLRAILSEMRENSTDAMTLGASRVNDLEERVTEITNASKWMDATMRRDMQNIQTQIDDLAQVQLDERLTQSEIRNLTFEVLDQRVALISENLAIAEHRVDSLETETIHKLKDIDSKLRNATHFWNATLSAMAEHVNKRLEGAVENASSYGDEVCSFPKDSGPCRNFTVKYFFDIANGGCSRFWYGGCYGNGNKFNTTEDCKNACVKPEGPDVCSLPMVKGSCIGTFTQWYYDKDLEDCLEFVFTGCQGNANRFKSKESCYQRCRKEMLVTTQAPVVSVDDYLVPATQPEPARILPGPSVIGGKIGEPAELPCNATGWPKPTVTWRRELRQTIMLPLASQRYEQLPNYALLIRSVVHEDAGVYSCEAHNGIGAGSIFIVRLFIQRFTT